MKIQDIIRHAAAVSFGIAVLWAGTIPVRAQEIVNTEFPSGPYVSSFEQPSAHLPTASTATTTAVTANNVLTPAAVPTPALAEQAALSAADYLRDTLVASSLFVLLLFVVYAIAEIRRNLNRGSSPRFTRGAVLS